MARFRTFLAVLFLLLAYGFVGSLDYLTELRLSCAQRYPGLGRCPGNAARHFSTTRAKDAKP